MFVKKLKFITVLCVFSVLCHASDRKGEVWPVGMSFVALVKNNWKLYIVKPGSIQPEYIKLTSEPRAPAYSPLLGLIAYISSEGNVMQYNLTSHTEKILISKEANLAYTQPVYSPSRKSLVVVELLKGKSNQTKIIEIDLKTNKIRILSRQRSAQFDPVIDNNNLYYSNVHCIENCAGRYVHEIWMKNMDSDDARQLTLLNSQTQQPAISGAGKFLFISSEKKHGKKIWKCNLKSAPPISCKEMFSDSIADTMPAVSKDGELYFMRLKHNGEKIIAKVSLTNKIEILSLPGEINEIRDMGIGY